MVPLNCENGFETEKWSIKSFMWFEYLKFKSCDGECCHDTLRSSRRNFLSILNSSNNNHDASFRLLTSNCPKPFSIHNILVAYQCIFRFEKRSAVLQFCLEWDNAICIPITVGIECKKLSRCHTMGDQMALLLIKLCDSPGMIGCELHPVGQTALVIQFIHTGFIFMCDGCQEKNEH